MEMENVLYQYRVVSTRLLTCALVMSFWAIGCRGDDPSCMSNDMCEQGEVCGSTGTCETRVIRQRVRRELFQRLGADIDTYNTWLQYGTAGAHTNQSTMNSDSFAIESDDKSLESRVSSHMHERGNDEPIYHDKPNDKKSETKLTHDPNVLCTIYDVRTDDLTFNTTRAYPGGYWGETPIADPHNGRCGDDLETLGWRLLNCERITRALSPVDCDLRLVWISRQHADDMATRDFFGHINPDGHDSFHRLSGRGIQYGLSGENLARQSSIYNAHQAWMRSPLHRRNILTEQYQYAGLGVIFSDKQLFMTETFLGGVKDEGTGIEPASHPHPIPSVAQEDFALE